MCCSIGKLTVSFVRVQIESRIQTDENLARPRPVFLKPRVCGAIMSLLLLSHLLLLAGVIEGAVVQRTGEGKVVRGQKFCYSGIMLTEAHCPDDIDGKT